MALVTAAAAVCYGMLFLCLDKLALYTQYIGYAWAVNQLYSHNNIVIFFAGYHVFSYVVNGN